METKNNFKFFAAPRIIGGVIAVLLILWIFSLFFESNNNIIKENSIASHGEVELHKPATQEKPSELSEYKQNTEEKSAAKNISAEPEDVRTTETIKNEKSKVEETSAELDKTQEKEESLYRQAPVPHPEVLGWTFVEAAIQPLDYELYVRSLGWRANDLILGKFTDNINNFQLGILEVTRRTTVKLTEDISRTGSTASLNKHLENAMNWFMIRPDQFWFPSAESKYKAGLKELKLYQAQLLTKESRFFNRSDNLIPLLKTYKNLLGSCDDNLVKLFEDDGSEVSAFKADDYFYYSQGVAKAMVHVLKAIEHDFKPILETRNGADSLHHAIRALSEAEEIKPWLILNHDLSGIFANHRANLATAISHGRFYLGVLITTLST